MNHTFNSSENFEGLEGNGARLMDFHIEPGQVAHVVLTHHKLYEPLINIYRVAGKVCASNCPENANKEIVRCSAEVKPSAPEHVITTPGHYYAHAPEQTWMKDGCNPTVLEVFISDKANS